MNQIVGTEGIWHERIKWVNISELLNYEMTIADGLVVKLLLQKEAII
jgi:hypothetical protein